MVIGLGSVPSGKPKAQSRQTDEDLALAQLKEMFASLGDEIVEIVWAEVEHDNLEAMTQLSQMVPDEGAPPSDI